MGANDNSMASTDDITAAFLTEKMGREVSAVKIRDEEKMGGMSADMAFLDVTMMSDGELKEVPMVLKKNPQETE